MARPCKCIYTGKDIQNIEEVLELMELNKDTYEEKKVTNIVTLKEDTNYITNIRYYDKNVTVMRKDRDIFLEIMLQLGFISNLEYAMEIRDSRYVYELWINGECIKPGTIFKSCKIPRK
jgi:hypothetical protein